MEVGVERHHALADVLGMVADPLQIVAHPHGADDLAQIDGHRLPAGDGQDRLFLDLMLHRVDGRIGGDHLFGEIGVAFDQGAGGIGDLPLGETAHLGDPALDVLQVGVEGLGGVVESAGGVFGHGCQPKRPVM